MRPYRFRVGKIKISGSGPSDPGTLSQSRKKYTKFLNKIRARSDQWGVCELKAELVGLGLSPSGTKLELVDRLVEAVDNMPNEGNTI